MNRDRGSDSIANSIAESFEEVWEVFVSFIPELIAGIIVFVIGWLIASALGKLVAKLVSLTPAETLLTETGVRAQGERVGVRLSAGALLGWLVKWFFIIVTLIAVADILGLQQLTLFLQRIVFYIPNVFVAVIILTVGFVAGEFIRRVVVRMLSAPNLAGGQPELVGTVAKYALITFATAAALIQLQIAPRLVEILFAGLVLTLALAFGLGGRDHASRWLDRVAPR